MKEKRVPKSYKIKESIYKKAMRAAKKDKTSLAHKIEVWVSLYANGNRLIARPNDNNNITVTEDFYKLS